MAGLANLPVASPPTIWQNAPQYEQGLLQINLPTAMYANNQTQHHHGEGWYWPFQHLGEIRVVRGPNGIRTVAPLFRWIRDCHIVYQSTKNPHNPVDFLNRYQRWYLEPFPPPGMTNWRDEAVYNHMWQNICGGMGNRFVFPNMTDLSWFLFHCQTRATPMLSLIQHITIQQSMVGPPHRIQAALQMLMLCTGLQTLRIELCRSCGSYEGSGGPGSAGEAAWMGFTSPARKMIVTTRRRGDSDKCPTCSAVGYVTNVRALTQAQATRRRNWIRTWPQRLRARG